MYESFFELSARPFDLTPSPQFLVLTESHREALRNLEYAIASRKGVTLLVGDAGAGKTTVIRAALEAQPATVHCVHINNPALTRNEFVELLAVRFGLSDRAAASKSVFLLELERLLRARRGAGETTVLVVDEAQSLSLELLEEIRLLANIETDTEKLISVILAGQPELADRLNEMSLRQLKQRVALRCSIRLLTVAETEVYIAWRIHAAGGKASLAFTREAVRRIHAAARGLPRVINVLADNALLGGFAAGVRPVTSDIVADVCRDFDFQAAPDTAAAVPAEAIEATPVPHAAETPKVPDDVRVPAPGGGGGGGLFESFARRRRKFSFFWG